MKVKKSVNVKIDFKCYEWDSFEFPANYGIYCIYKSKKNSEGKYVVDRLVYVGISDNINRRIKEHSNTDYPSKGKYCYLYSELEEDKAKLAEAAIINECKPEGNSKFIDSYPEDYDHVQLIISGNHIDIPRVITK